MQDIQPMPTDKEYLECRATGKVLTPKIERLVADARAIADTAKKLQGDFLVAGEDDRPRIKRELAGQLAMLSVKQREAEALRTEAFALSKKYGGVAVRFAKAERELRFVLAEKTAAEAAQETIRSIGGNAVSEIERLKKSICNS